MTILAKALELHLAGAKLQHVKSPKSVHAVCQFSCLSLFHFLDCTQLALAASVPNPQREEQNGQHVRKRTYSRVGSRALQLHSKVGRTIEYVGTEVMDPEDHGHHPGPMTLLGLAQFATPDRLSKIFARNKTSAAVEKLEGIQDLWRALGRTKKNSPDYETLMNKNRVLSAEYQVMVDTPRKREESK